MSTSPGLRPRAPASMCVCTFVAALIVTAPGLFSAGAEGTMSAAATIAAAPPTSLPLSLVIATVPPFVDQPPYSAYAGGARGRARPAGLETACICALRGGARLGRPRTRLARLARSPLGSLPHASAVAAPRADARGVHRAPVFRLRPRNAGARRGGAGGGGADPDRRERPRTPALSE